MNSGVITYCYVGLDRILTYDEYKAWQKQVTEIKQANRVAAEVWRRATRRLEVGGHFLGGAGRPKYQPCTHCA